MGRGLVLSLSLNRRCQFAKTFTLLTQQLYVQIIHAETKHAPLGSKLRQLPWSTWVIKYIFRNWPKHPCSNHQPVVFIIYFLQGVCKQSCINSLTIIFMTAMFARGTTQNTHGQNTHTSKMAKVFKIPTVEFTGYSKYPM